MKLHRIVEICLYGLTMVFLRLILVRTNCIMQHIQAFYPSIQNGINNNFVYRTFTLG
jgi:hypothetical protein